MNKFILAIVVVQLVVIAAGKPQEAPETEGADAEAVAQSETSTEAPLLKNPPQCIYDVKRFRLNKECRVEGEPICEKGELVATKIGAIFEMCCCDYSNYHGE